MMMLVEIRIGDFGDSFERFRKCMLNARTRNDVFEDGRFYLQFRFSKNFTKIKFWFIIYKASEYLLGVI